ncbi:MAG: NAD kinase [Alphaproteobacteria bacterium]|nr:NAD kinase [Alphaproteobacteria bacterium]
MKYKNLSFVASKTADAQAAKAMLIKKYGDASVDKADVIIALGGDGLMLECLRHHNARNLPIYGLNRGTVGFLMNAFNDEDLHERLNEAQQYVAHPLMANIKTMDGKKHKALAFNEVSLLRQTHQAAKLHISINQKPRLEELVCDGIIVATPVGSTAYNLSAHGPIIPINTPLIALTPISPFRPRHWRGALLPDDVSISIKICDPEKRPVSAVADHQEVRNVSEISVKQCKDKYATMLFDAKHGLEERILREQFGY